MDGAGKQNKNILKSKENLNINGDYFFPVTLETKSLRNFADFVMGELTAIKLYNTFSTSTMEGRDLNLEMTFISPPSSSTRTDHCSPLKTPSLTHLKTTPFLLLKIPFTSKPRNEYITSNEPTKALISPKLSSSSKAHLGLNSTTGFGYIASVTAFITANLEDSGAKKTATSLEPSILVFPSSRTDEISVWSTITLPAGIDSKAFFAATESGHSNRNLTGGPFLLMDRSGKTLVASSESESIESSMIGISTRNLGCLSFLSLPDSFGLFRGFSRVAERQVLAWRMASSLEAGGLEEEEAREEWTERPKGRAFLGSVGGQNVT
ncbi:hypothetical protein SAY87_005090 [Trapa incisa]|uniref:Uncharacterized protein n=1 Tax=Trapa incisa TaxID=236973 RepID=A0AAN7PPE2_9MYRT|nr:hypothetical protein SAY87_005090 [Trapa incisa]